MIVRVSVCFDMLVDRFVLETITVLNANDCFTQKQFECMKADDVAFGDGNNQGKKSFLRMALKKLKQAAVKEARGETFL